MYANLDGHLVDVITMEIVDYAPISLIAQNYIGIFIRKSYQKFLINNCSCGCGQLPSNYHVFCHTNDAGMSLMVAVLEILIEFMQLFTCKCQKHCNF